MSLYSCDNDHTCLENLACIYALGNVHKEFCNVKLGNIGLECGAKRNIVNLLYNMWSNILIPEILVSFLPKTISDVRLLML